MSRFVLRAGDRAVRLASEHYVDMDAEAVAEFLNKHRIQREAWTRVSIQADQIVEEEIARFLPLQDTVTMLEKLVRQAIEVRKLQKTYFRTRLPADLAASKAAEKAFDDAAELFLNPPAETLI